MTNTLVFQYIIDNVLFEPNKQNIYIITQKLDNSNDGIYTKILKSNNINLIDYINQNLIYFVSQILLDSNEIHEDENSIIKLLNTNILSLDDKYRLIEIMDIQISFITSVENLELYDVLFKENKVFPNWENIYNYYKLRTKFLQYRILSKKGTILHLLKYYINI